MIEPENLDLDILLDNGSVILNWSTLASSTSQRLLRSHQEDGKWIYWWKDIEGGITSYIDSITTIRYSLSQHSDVSLKIVDILGREVRELVNENKPDGNYRVKFDATQLSEGIYFSVLENDGNRKVRRMIVLD